MKNAKYLVLSAAALLAVGCSGNKMAKVTDEEAVGIATALGEYHQGIIDGNFEDFPTKLTITKTYHETHESNLFYQSGKIVWEDDETYKIELDLEKARVSIEISDSDTAIEQDDRGVSRYEKIDYVHRNGNLYYYLNYNNVAHVYDTCLGTGEHDLDDSREFLINHVVYNPTTILRPTETVATVTTSVISIPYNPTTLAWDNTYITGIWNYLTGEYDMNLDYIFHDIVYRGDTPVFFPGFKEMITAAGDYSIHGSMNKAAEAIKAGSIYRDGSYAKYYYGANDKKNKKNLYVESNSKLGYTVNDISGTDYADDVRGNAAICDYKTDLSYTYKNNYVTESTLNHDQELLFTLNGKKTGEYLKRHISQKVNVKLESKVASSTLNYDDYSFDDYLVA